MRKKLKTTGGAFVLLMGVTAAEKLLSFVYQAVIAAKLGATTLTDSYFTASEFITLIDATVFGALVVVLLNQYANTIEEQGEPAGRSLLSNVLSISLVGGFALGLLLLILAQPIAFVLAPGFEEQQRAVLARCVRCLAFVPMMVAFYSVYQIVLRHRKKFVAISIKSLFISIVGMIAVLFFVDANSQYADALCVGYLISILSYCLFTRLASTPYGIIGICRPKVTPEIKTLAGLVLPMIIGNGITRAAQMVDKIVASIFGDGMISCLSYAQALDNFVGSFFVTNICTILLTDFVQMSAKNEREAMKCKVSSTVLILMLLLVPITLLTILYHKEIVAIVFGRGEFAGDDVEVAAQLLMWYALGFVPTMIQNIYLRVHYAFNDTITAMKNGLIAVICNFVVSIGLAALIGINGIAVGTVIATVVSMVLCGKTMRKHLPGYKLFENKKYLLRVAVAGLFCVSAAFGMKHILQIAALASFVCVTLVGGTVFFVTLIVLREPALNPLIDEIRMRMKRDK